MTDPGYGKGLASTHDDAKRMYDAVVLHYHALPIEQIITTGVYVAIRLSDGGSDNTPYDSHHDAVTHQLGVDRNRYLYFKLPPVVPSVRECATILGYARRCYDCGYRPAGAHEGAELIIPNLVEDLT